MAYNIDNIRDDFPVLKQAIRGKPPIYFDNACMTLRPRQVLEAMNRYYLCHPSCHKRAMHSFGEMTSARYEEARQAIQKFINAKMPQEVIFTRNTTESINLIANAFPFENGDIVLTTELEHNSNLLPWQVLSQGKGVIHRIFALGQDSSFDLDNFKDILAQGRVRLVSVFQTSHVTGQSLPVKAIIDVAHQYGVLVLLDGAQSVGHQKIDVQELDVDFFGFSFHKMLGPSGMGALYAKKAILEQMRPFLVGGETVEDVDYVSFVLAKIPDKFEAGLQNYAGAIGAKAAIEYLRDIPLEARNQHVLKLNNFITEKILKLPRLNLLGPKDAALRGGIINFFIDGMDSGDLSIFLDKTNNIMVRSGLHCAHAWYKKHKLVSTVRVSLYFYNTMQEAELFNETIEKIVKYF
ncbi:aminotransferase class V-fold PLP-dependent enzyme [Candidatus Gottesmanbacteria bacterium]|nr:aminotransferase class V-fold PLP-dependent enzyme [Candidatus Gottesmanbacteria bacterium]